MTDPRTIAAGIVGPVDWQSEVSGFCRCPGESLHTQKTGRKDCRVSVDGAPTIFCFHASCARAVAEANRRLRRELGAGRYDFGRSGYRASETCLGHFCFPPESLRPKATYARKSGCQGVQTF